jgi:beta-glucanase (GH16 family)
MPVGDLPGWKQVFAEDFTRAVPLGRFPAAVSAKWFAYPDGWRDTSGNGTYYPSRVNSIHDGVLDWYVHTEGALHMVSAPVPRLPGSAAGAGQLYGRYAVRFRADMLPGYKTAWLLWPDSDAWPRDGEIDFPEGDLDGTICAFTHHQGATSGSDQDAFCTGATYRRWHTAVIDWSPGKVRYLLDGRLIGTSRDRVPRTRMHWVLQTETALGGLLPDDATAGHVQVDWVAVYRPA